MRQQRPPIKRSLLKPPPPSRIREAATRFDIGPRAGPVYTLNIHIYTQGLRARGPFSVPTSIVPERRRLILSFPPSLSLIGYRSV